MDNNMLNSEVPEVINNDSHQNSSHPASPIFLIAGSLLIFVSTAAILFFNYKQTSNASSKNNNIYLQKYQNSLRLSAAHTAVPQLAPTPESAEEASVENVVIEEGTSDFTTIDQAANGL